MIERNKASKRQIGEIHEQKDKSDKMLQLSQKQWEDERADLNEEFFKLQEDMREYETKNCTSAQCDHENLQGELEAKTQQIIKLTNEVDCLQAELGKAQEKFQKFQTSSKIASSILSKGRSYKNTSGLGFTSESSHQTKFVKATDNYVDEIDCALEPLPGTHVRNHFDKN